MAQQVRGLAPHASRRPAVGYATVQRPRHVQYGADVRRHAEPATARYVAPRPRPETKRPRYGGVRRPPTRIEALRHAIEDNLFRISAALLIVGAAGWCLLIYSELKSPILFAPAHASAYMAESDADLAKTNAMGTSTYVRVDRPAPAAALAGITAVEQTSSIGETANTLVTRDFSSFAPLREANQNPAPKAAKLNPPVRVATLENAPPALMALPPRPEPVAPNLPDNIKARTSLIDFENAPFPYHGTMPGSDRPFLNAGSEGHRGHVSFRGNVLWEAQTFSDDHVLLHIPPGFDPNRPAVMVVFFHGHGAGLARDVRDRQQVPAQISASGMNAVLVAPQFAFDAADSSAGKFWQPNGFKRFLDEAAVKLAKLYGDPKSTAAFANMPIVLVSYSGGYGPTLAVLDKGGVKTRVRGLVLLDSLYSGIPQFADWIASHRSAFFISSYTPHTAYHNADLEHQLRERSVPYSSELRHEHLDGMVAFLPTGAISHRDFVNRAWANSPIKDILARMDDVDPSTQNAANTAPARTSAAATAASTHN